MTYQDFSFGNGIASLLAMILSLLTSLPETSSLFLVGTFMILAGLVLRRVFNAVEKGIASVSSRSAETRQNPLKLDHKDVLSHPVSPRP